MATTKSSSSATPVDDLMLGRSDQSIVCRILRFWDSKNIKKQGKFMGIIVLLLDAKETAIHGFITAARSYQYHPYLKTGSIVRVSRFEVARCAKTYKLTDHPFLIRFIPQTIIEDVMVDCPLIGRVKFISAISKRLRVSLTQTLNLRVIVSLYFGHMCVYLPKFDGVVVYMSLWDDAASVFRGLLQSGDRTPSIMIVTTVNPKLFGGNLYLNSTPATTFTFDPTLEDVSLFAASLGEPITTAFTCTDTKEGIKKKEVVSIRELNKFITDSNEQVSIAALSYDFQEAEVELALLDNAASVFRRLLSSPEKMHRAMLFTSLNPKRIGGSLCLLSTIGTRFYFPDEFPALTHITKTLGFSQMHKLSLLDVGPTVNASQISAIGDLNTFLADTESKEPLLSCKARIFDIIYPAGWLTVSCSECEQLLHCSSAQQACIHTSPRCIVRYQVEMLVDDGQNYAVFSVGDKDILGLTKHKASSLATQEVLNTNCSIPPPSLEQLRGGVYVFHVLTTPIFTSQSGPFSVVGISEVAENDLGIALVQNPAEEGT
ncbi:unnamed protein product [Cochlearia groenlandica]